MAYKVVITFPDGETFDSYEDEGDDGIFDTEEEARDYFCEWMGNYSTGGEVLHLSNPGDYPLNEDEEDPDYEIVEI